jgi:hypothetical protein
LHKAFKLRIIGWFAVSESPEEFPTGAAKPMVPRIASPSLYIGKKKKMFGRSTLLKSIAGVFLRGPLQKGQEGACSRKKMIFEGIGKTRVAK